MEKTRKERYDEWVERVCRFVEEVGPGMGASSAMQSRPVLEGEPVVFLGYNAHESYGYMGVKRERFYEGNPWFYENRDDLKWKVWHRMKDAFTCEWVNWPWPVTDGNFVFMNAVYFGSDSIRELQKKPGSKEVVERCLDFTAEVIREVFRPRGVVCFSIGDCFQPLARRFGFTEVESLHPTNMDGQPGRQRVTKGMWGGIPTFGIPHPSGRVSYADWGGIAMWLKGELTKRETA